jgi:hypothetical protein
MGGLLFVLFFFKFAENALGGGSMNKRDFRGPRAAFKQGAQIG